MTAFDQQEQVCVPLVSRGNKWGGAAEGGDFSERSFSLRFFNLPSSLFPPARHVTAVRAQQVGRYLMGGQTPPVHDGGAITASAGVPGPGRSRVSLGRNWVRCRTHNSRWGSGSAAAPCCNCGPQAFPELTAM